MREQKEKVKEFLKIKFYSYFDRFDQVLEFSRKLILGLLVGLVILASLNIWLLTAFTKRTKEISEYVRATTLYLKQQELLNASVLATRIASDYFRLSYDNFDQLSSNLRLLFYPRRKKVLEDQLRSLRHIIVNGRISQWPEKVEYSKVAARKVYVYDGRRKILSLFVSVPMTVIVEKENSRPLRMNVLFGVYFVRSHKGLSNPYGLDIFDFGKIEGGS